MDVIGSDISFVQGIGKLVSDRQLSGVGILTPEVPLMYRLLDVLINMKKVFDDQNIKAEPRTLLSDLIRFGNAVAYLNKESQILYSFEDSMSPSKSKRSLKVACKLIPYCMESSKIVKMYVNFNKASIYEDRYEDVGLFAASIKMLLKNKETKSNIDSTGFMKNKKRMNFLVDTDNNRQHNYQFDISQDEDAACVFIQLSCMLWDISKDHINLCPISVRQFILDLNQIVKDTEDICNSMNTAQQLSKDKQLSKYRNIGTLATLMKNQASISPQNRSMNNE